VPHPKSNSENLFLTDFDHTLIKAISKTLKVWHRATLRLRYRKPVINFINLELFGDNYLAVKTTSIKSAALCRTLNPILKPRYQRH